VDQGTPLLSLATVTGGNGSAVLVTGGVAVGGAVFKIDNQCDITGAPQDGIQVSSGGAAPKVTVTRSLIHGNGNDGVQVISGSLGASPQVTLGYPRLPVCSINRMPLANDIFCNTRYGVEGPILQVGGTAVEANGNAWHNDPPTSGAAPADINNAFSVNAGCPAPANPTVCP
jgi:hypothetical protein